MLFGTCVGAEGAYIVNGLFIYEFELGKRGRLAFILGMIKQGSTFAFMLLRIDMLLIGLWRHELLGADFTVDFAVALTFGGQFGLKFWISEKATNDVVMKGEGSKANKFSFDVVAMVFRLVVLLVGEIFFEMELTVHAIVASLDHIMVI